MSDAFGLLQAPKKARRLQFGQLSEFPAHDPPRPIPTSTKAAPHRARPRRAACSADPVFNFWSFPMSALFDATALVVPFENLRMTDVEAVGGKNASLGEMISQLPQGVRVPTGFATTAHAFRAVPRARRPGRNASAQRLATLDTEDVRALAAAGAEIRALDRGPAVPGRPGEGDPRRVRHAVAPATRRPASPCAPRPRPKTCPTPRSPASRKPSSTWSASKTCCTR